MEPLTALGIAGNVAQFLELGASIFKNAREIADNGSTVSIKHLATLASDMETLSAGLRDQYSGLGAEAQKDETVSHAALPLYTTGITAETYGIVSRHLGG